MELYIPWFISGFSLLIAYLSYRRNLKKDDVSDTQAEEDRFHNLNENLLKVNLKLDQLCTTTNETRVDIKTLTSDFRNLEGRMIVVEHDLKNAFCQIEELKRKDGVSE